jgi:hypothetical protein
MPFAVAAAGISAGAGLLGSSMQSSAIQKGQQQATMAQLYAQNQMRGDLGGYMTAGRNATDFAQAASGAQGQDNPLFRQNIALALSGNLGPEAAQGAMENFYTSPGYQYRLDEGLRAVDAGAAARGMLRSGATLKAEQAFGEGLAAQEYGNYYTRANDSFQQYYNRLFDMTKLGESAAAGVGAAGIQTGQGIAQTDAAAAGANANIYGNLAKGVSTGINTLMNSDLVKDYFKPAVSDVSGGTGNALWT